MARSLAQRLARRGVDMLDAPVSGGEQGAIAATLAIMVGGRAAVLERVRPLFECSAHDRACRRPRRRAGRQGVQSDGDGGAIQAVAEALHLSRAAGADPARVLQAARPAVRPAAGCSK
jgi:2-hydroxy-3-oxopropionate reductase